MNYRYNASLLISLLILLSSNSGAANVADDACRILRSSKYKKQIPANTSQIILVKSLGNFKAKVTLCQRQKMIWKSIHSFIPAVIGKNGIAPIGKKREGDSKTPAGLYSIGETFGTRPSLGLKMDYRYITSDDKFIDDISHTDYNTWITGPTDAKSYEAMLIEPYTYGAVVNYNMHPIKAGAGSAIFIHLWYSSNSPTAGCIALAKKPLAMMLHWLDKSQHPHILVH